MQDEWTESKWFKMYGVGGAYAPMQLHDAFGLLLATIISWSKETEIESGQKQNVRLRENHQMPILIQIILTRLLPTWLKLIQIFKMNRSRKPVLSAFGSIPIQSGSSFLSSCGLNVAQFSQSVESWYKDK